MHNKIHEHVNLHCLLYLVATSTKGVRRATCPIAIGATTNTPNFFNVCNNDTSLPAPTIKTANNGVKMTPNKLPKIADIITIQSGLKNKNLEDRFKNQFSILVNFFSWLYKMRHIKQKSIIVEKQFNIVDKWIHNMYREAKKTENLIKKKNKKY